MPKPRVPSPLFPGPETPFLAPRAGDCPTIRRWVLRLVLSGAITPRNLLEDAAPDTVEFIESPTFDWNQQHRLWRRELARLDRKLGTTSPMPEPLEHNSRTLANLLGISEESRVVLCFLVSMRREPVLNRMCRKTLTLEDDPALELLASMLGFPRDQASAVLGRTSELSLTGLLRINSNAECLFSKWDTGSATWIHDLAYPMTDAVALFRDSVREAPPPDVGWSDFDHLGESRQLLRTLLEQRFKEPARATNILLHGPPGVGKTMLPRVLAKELGAECYEVGVDELDGEPQRPDRRLRSLRIAGTLLRSRRAFLVFDEFEDVSPPDAGLGGRGLAHMCKGFLNHVLESNRLPTFWITNAPAAIAPAFLRRFDLVLGLPNPPRAQRRRAIARVAPHLREETIERLVSSSTVTPAIIARAVGVAACMQSGADTSEALDRWVGLAVEGTLKAQAAPPLSTGQTGPYRADYVNTDRDLDGLVAGLGRTGEGRLLIHGPPGTGKSAFGRFVAEKTGRALLVKRSSDLLDSLVGRTEQRIAEAFAEARTENAVLVLDEIDSFLGTRAGSQRMWEVTLTNEMLTQLEAFDGIFIATTNRLDSLDPACLRRFDAKLHFDYLRPAQARALFSEHLSNAGLPAPTPADDQALNALGNLAPGDFAAVARRNRFDAVRTPAAWIEALALEAALRAPPRRPLGFRPS